MSKSKKHKTPRINPPILARPRLDALLTRRARAAVGTDALAADLRALMAELGDSPVLDALVKHLEGTPGDERETLILQLIELHAAESATLIERAFAERRVDEFIMGDWEDVEVELRLKAARQNQRWSGGPDRSK